MKKTLIKSIFLAILNTPPFLTGSLDIAMAEIQAPLHLNMLIEKALGMNSELKAIRSQLRIERARIGPAGTLEDPMISLEAMNLPSNSLRFDRVEMSGFQIALTQKIPFPGKLAAKQEVAILRSKSLEQRIRQKELETARDVKRIYFELYLKAKKQDILENQRTLLRQTLATSRSQYTLNQLPQTALLNLQVQEASIINDQLRLSSEMKDLEAEMAHITGHADHAQKIIFTPIRNTKQDLSRWQEDEITQLVLVQNTEVQALQSEVRESDANVNLARKGNLPDFELMASYTIRETIRGMDEPNNGQDLVGAKIGVSIPLWGASKQSEQINEALAMKEKAEHLLQNARLMQIHQARALLTELKESQQRIALFESGLLQLSKQAVASGRAAYIAGKLHYNTMLETLQTQQNTEYAYQEALVSYEIQQAKLEALLGKKLGNNPNE